MPETRSSASALGAVRAAVVVGAAIAALSLTVAASGAPAAATSVIQISASGDHTCAVTSGGGVKCWGSNWYGQLGNGVQCTATRCTKQASGIPVDVVGLGSGVKSVSAGGYHSCALTARGAVKCWGYNATGQLGNGGRTCPSLDVCPRARNSTPVDVIGLASRVTAVAGGGFFSCALTTKGSVKCWGANRDGQLGNPSGDASSRPVEVAGLSSEVSTIAAGGLYSCAVTTGGAAKCWGSSPAVIAGLASGVTSVAVSPSATESSSRHACALTSNGGVKCWGSNDAGQLGNGSQTDSFTPVAVAGLTSGVKAIAAGGAFTCALTNGGGVKCWGRNSSGELGSGSRTNSRTPVDVVGLRTGVSAITAGTLSACALTTQGKALCWGSNYRGTLGTGTAIKLSTKPVDVVFTAKPDSKPAKPSAPSAGGIKSGYFKTPSGNIVCYHTPGPADMPRAFIGCGIKSGLKPAPPRRPCQEGGYAGDRVSMNATGPVDVPACAGDPGALVGESRARVLAYGKAWSGGGIRCTSATTGLTCRNKSGHGFFLSRESWRRF